MEGRLHAVVVHYECDMHEWVINEDKSSYTMLITAIFQALLGDEYGERTMSFHLAGLVRGFNATFPINSDSTFYNLLLRNRNEEDPIQLVVPLDEVITESMTPPRASTQRASAHIICELPEENPLAIVPWSGSQQAKQGDCGNGDQVENNMPNEAVAMTGNEAENVNPRASIAGLDNMGEGVGGLENQVENDYPMEDVAGLNNLDEGVGGNGNEEENGNPMEYFDELDNLDEGFNGLDGDGDMYWGTGQVEYEEPISFYHEQYETEMGCEKEAEVFDDYEEESDSDDPSYDNAPYEASDDDT